MDWTDVQQYIIINAAGWEYKCKQEDEVKESGNAMEMLLYSIIS